ncbi:gastric triacylglycerol lipase-like [Branchiostoma floridae]|uniref:Gastric triacylglycerol lipase-like n=1 Tax=Branchiostoma floridae TaxID=7739 RepID=A0A9J7HRJ6_BRAFL|nr:gastric triacylglycerol lipase-like [Branchiostoma floridae]
MFQDAASSRDWSQGDKMARIADDVLHVLVIFSVILTASCFSPPIKRLWSLGEDPEVHMNATQLITSKGYPCEDYTVKTDDGFLLGVQRIPYGRNATSHKDQRPAIFLQHGLLSASTDWILNLANESLAFILADAGFDVWLGNMRGNTYSRKHVKYTPDDDEFWDFSWDEMAKYDLPAMVTFALNTTGQSSLYYVGHSQGTAIAFAHLSQDLEFAKKVKTFFALAPVVTLGHITSPIKYLAQFDDIISAMFHIFGVDEFLPNSWWLDWLASFLCDKSTEKYCENMLFLLVGFDPVQLNETRLPVYFSHTPAGTSTKNMVHFAQMVNSNKFQAYDYGNPDENKQHYNQPTAPVYPIENMTTPVALFWGGNDWLADPTDVQAAIPQLRNVIYNSEIKNFDHMDFIWGKDATKLYDQIIKIIRKAELVSFYHSVFEPGPVVIQH